jgi:hypothetical protein
VPAVEDVHHAAAVVAAVVQPDQTHLEQMVALAVANRAAEVEEPMVVAMVFLARVLQAARAVQAQTRVVPVARVVVETRQGTAGSTGSVWTSTYSSGGGGGGAGTAAIAGYSGAQGGGYGSGGGGGSINGSSVGPGGTGAPGLIVITYTPTTGGTTASDATVSGTNIVGWARACAGTSAGDCSTMTSRTDGWDGWIALSGTGYATSLLGCSSYSCAGNWAWGGEAVGWISFNITGTAPSVTTNAATGISAVTATLNGTGNPNNSSAVGYFRYSTTNPGSCDDVFGARVPSSSGTALGSGSSGVSFFQNISSLTPGTTYYYCALASSTNGVGMGAISSFTTTSDICSDISGNQASVPTGCQSPVPSPYGACIPSGYTWNGSQCVASPPVISSFYATPNRVKAGGSVTLFYTVANPPASCTIRSNAGFGPVTVNPTNNVQGSTSGGTVSSATIFTLTCGSVSSSITVRIQPVYKEI